jgi:hypothetical protein
MRDRQTYRNILPTIPCCLTCEHSEQGEPKNLSELSLLCGGKEVRPLHKCKNWRNDFVEKKA